MTDPAAVRTVAPAVRIIITMVAACALLSACEKAPTSAPGWLEETVPVVEKRAPGKGVQANPEARKSVQVATPAPQTAPAQEPSDIRAGKGGMGRVGLGSLPLSSAGRGAGAGGGSATVPSESSTPGALAGNKADGALKAPKAAALQGASGYGAGAGGFRGAQAADDALAALGALMGDQIGSSFGWAHGAGGGRDTPSRSASPVGRRPVPRLASGPGQPNREAYTHITDNAFLQVTDSPLSTFSVDVDTASYANVRRMLNEGQRPPVDAVRIEEFVNYFNYDYPAPRGDTPFSIHSEVGAAPWRRKHRLVHIGLQGRTIAQDKVPARNLVFLLDVSGSMSSPRKLPLLKQGMKRLVSQLREKDQVSIVVYAGASGLVLPPTGGARKDRIVAALDQLQAGGATNGASGIELAYQTAEAQFVTGGINRVILATDGDFNVGLSSHGELTRLIETKRKTGVFLTVLGFGSGNLQDNTMEALADKGNGNYAYIDSVREAEKVLVREAGSTLVTIAKDVKLQVEWNPEEVEAYRLIGYENRMLAAQDFNDDKKDAGEMGAGHTVTALYEVVLKNNRRTQRGGVDPLKYQSKPGLTAAAASGELFTVKFRYKAPSEARSRLITHVVRDQGKALSATSRDFRFSAAVAGFGMVLRRSEHRGKASLSSLRRLARSALGSDPHGQRRDLIELMDAAGRAGVDG